MGWLRWALMAVACLLGLWLPEFYDWSGEDQSRPAPVVRYIALGIALFNVVAIGWLVWSHCTKPSSDQHTNVRKSFSIGHVLAAMAIVALVLAVEPRLKMPLGYAVLLSAIGYAGWLAVQQPVLRSHVVTLVVCMWAPFLWAFRWPEFYKQMLLVWLMLPSAPGFALIAASSFLVSNTVEVAAWTALFTTLQLLVGVWFLRFSSQLALASALGLLTLSLFSSFILHALVRA